MSPIHLVVRGALCWSSCPPEHLRRLPRHRHGRCRVACPLESVVTSCAAGTTYDLRQPFPTQANRLLTGSCLKDDQMCMPGYGCDLRGLTRSAGLVIIFLLVLSCSVPSGSSVPTSTTPVASPTTDTVAAGTTADANAPTWCGVLAGSTAVEALPTDLPHLLVPEQRSSAQVQVRRAADDIQRAARAGSESDRSLLDAAAAALRAAADNPTTASLQYVSAAFGKASEGIQSVCGYH